MIDRDYALRHASPPGPLKRGFDQQVVAALIDVAGMMEAAVERVAARVRHAPASALGCAVVLGLAFAMVRPTARR